MKRLLIAAILCSGLTGCVRVIVPPCPVQIPTITLTPGTNTDTGNFIAAPQKVPCPVRHMLRKLIQFAILFALSADAGAFMILCVGVK